MSAQAVEERKDVAGEPEKAAAAVESGGAPAQPAAKPPVRAKLATPSVAAAGLLRQNGAAAPDRPATKDRGWGGYTQRSSIWDLAPVILFLGFALVVAGGVLIAVLFGK